MPARVHLPPASWWTSWLGKHDADLVSQHFSVGHSAKHSMALKCLGFGEVRQPLGSVGVDTFSVALLGFHDLHSAGVGCEVEASTETEL